MSAPNKYQREIKPGVWVDVYDVLKAFSVVNPALQHLVKKALAVGQRGHKDVAEDLQDIIDSAVRAKELEGKPTCNHSNGDYERCGMVRCIQCGVEFK